MTYLIVKFRKLIVPIICCLFVVNVQGAERHYSLAQSVAYDDNADFDNVGVKSNVSHLSSANISYQDVTAKFSVNVDTDIQYVNHSRIGLNDGASANGVAEIRYTVLPGRWNIGLRDLAVYSRDYSELEASGNEEQVNTLSYSTDVGFKLGSLSNISISGDRSRTENEDDTEFDAVSKLGRLTLQNSLSPLTNLNLTYTYTDTVQFFNGGDVGSTRLESKSAGITRVFTRSNLSLSAGITSPVGSLSGQDDIDNYSFSYRHTLNSRLDVQLLARKDASNTDTTSAATATIIDGLSQDERGDLVVDWVGGGIASFNLRLFYGESETLITNTSRIAAILNLGGSDLDNDTKARFHGWELSAPSTVTPSLTLIPTIRMETRQFEGLQVTRDRVTSNLEFVSSVGEIKQFMMSLSANYRVNTALEINATFERRIADEDSIDRESASLLGPVTNTVITDIKPNANVFSLSVQYNI